MSARFSLPDPEQIIQELLSRVDISYPPVKLPKVLSIWPNLRVVEEDLDGAGYLLPIGNLGAEIVVNKNNSDQRKLFTTAHELGHWVLGLKYQKETGEFRQPTEVPRAAVEKWCDAFATNLLMPAPLVRGALPAREQPFLVDALLRVADRFRVSQEAFFIRVWELQRIQIAVVTLGARPTIERTYANAKCRELLKRVLQDTEVNLQLQIAGAIMFFTLSSASGSIYVSGKKLGAGKAVLAVAWPTSDATEG